MPRSTIRTLIGIVALFAVGSCTVISFQSRVAYNTSRDKVWLRLPEDATRIHLFQPGAFGPNTYFEFDTSEESFFEWVRGYPKVTRSPKRSFRFRRYPSYSPEADRSSNVTIADGHLFGWSEEDRGRYIAYDKDAGRAYYWSHTR